MAEFRFGQRPNGGSWDDSDLSIDNWNESLNDPKVEAEATSLMLMWQNQAEGCTAAAYMAALVHMIYAFRDAAPTQQAENTIKTVLGAAALEPIPHV